VDQRCYQDPSTPRQQTKDAGAPVGITNDERNSKMENRNSGSPRHRGPAGKPALHRRQLERNDRGYVGVGGPPQQAVPTQEEKPHELTSFVGCVAKSLTPKGCATGALSRGLAEDTQEHSGGVVDLEIAFVLGESDLTEGFSAAHANDGEALRVVNTAGAGGKNP
jgi:hypothetical protein